ncbi:MAG: peptidoglycan DD-metalloendopeptidase family protein [Alphaproteobacteria bacterium]|nr:peptidoglycan DD-metalloendopeptidase family protein [Alphaproteobacteria bacterium]
MAQRYPGRFDGRGAEPAPENGDVPPVWRQQWRAGRDSPYQAGTVPDIAWRFGRELDRKVQAEAGSRASVLHAPLGSPLHARRAPLGLSARAPDTVPGPSPRVAPGSDGFTEKSLFGAPPRGRPAHDSGQREQDRDRPQGSFESSSRLTLNDPGSNTGPAPVLTLASKDDDPWRPPREAPDSALQAAPRLKNPVPGGGIRNDRKGRGGYRERRTNTDGAVYEHQGVDIGVAAGAQVLVPLDGVVTKVGWSYRGEQYRYVEIQTPDRRFAIRVHYVAPQNVYEGKSVVAGDVMGRAQGISQRPNNAGMDDHIHVEVWDRSTETEPKETRPADKGWKPLNPTDLIEGFKPEER